MMHYSAAKELVAFVLELGCNIINDLSHEYVYKETRLKKILQSTRKLPFKE